MATSTRERAVSRAGMTDSARRDPADGRPPTDVVQVLRGTGWLLLGSVLVSLAIAWALTPRGEPLADGELPPAGRYTATVLLGHDPDALERTAYVKELVEVGVVLELAAERMELPAGRVAEMVDVDVLPEETGLTLEVSNSDPAVARDLAQALSEELVGHLSGQRVLRRDAEVARLRAAVVEQAELVEDLQQQVESDPDDPLLTLHLRLARVEATDITDALALTQSTDVSSPTAPLGPPAVAASSAGGYTATTPLGVRIGAVALTSLAVAVLLTLAAAAADPRLRTRESIEQAFGARVLASIQDGRGHHERALPPAAQAALRGVATQVLAASRHDEQTAPLIITVASATRTTDASRIAGGLAAAMSARRLAVSTLHVEPPGGREVDSDDILQRVAQARPGVDVLLVVATGALTLRTRLASLPRQGPLLLVTAPGATTRGQGHEMRSLLVTMTGRQVEGVIVMTAATRLLPRRRQAS